MATINQIKLPGSTSTYDISVANKLTAGSKQFDGSSAVTITANDIGALSEEDLEEVSTSVEGIGNNITTINNNINIINNKIDAIEDKVGGDSDNHIVTSGWEMYWGLNIVNVEDGIKFSHQ